MKGKIKKYYLIHKKTDSYITTKKPKNWFYDEFESFDEAKETLIFNLNQQAPKTFIEFHNALKGARALRKSDFEESENAD